METDIILNNLPNDVKQSFKLFYKLYPPAPDHSATLLFLQTQDIYQRIKLAKYTPNLKIEHVDAFLRKGGYKEEIMGSNDNYYCWLVGLNKSSSK